MGAMRGCLPRGSGRRHVSVAIVGRSRDIVATDPTFFRARLGLCARSPLAPVVGLGPVQAGPSSLASQGMLAVTQWVIASS